MLAIDQLIGSLLALHWFENVKRAFGAIAQDLSIGVELRGVGEDLVTFCEGYAEAVKENQRLRAILEALPSE